MLAMLTYADYGRGLAILVWQSCDTHTPPRPLQLAPARQPSEVHRGGGRAKQVLVYEALSY